MTLSLAAVAAAIDAAASAAAATAAVWSLPLQTRIVG